ncbi:hypothetical protein [Dyadobacter sp. CY323]|uniref:hypothetical protein n=1 Tax=Dyadobacter sp. CY323 TaxID=2907302 RepID=UPI001F2AB58C|nr:hypothetical protein [Dyadobacter sp. CY323]MCE6990786.1 hypothetical protein [Dyadobacter sp. CY323]
MEKVDLWINIIANSLTIIASSIAIYVFYFNRDKIKHAINLILDYSNQLTLTDLKFKIERLNDFNANEQAQKAEIINILHEIEGQINGNPSLREKLKAQLDKINSFITNSKIFTEPKKRSLVSELKESIRNIDVSSFNNLVNSKPVN